MPLEPVDRAQLSLRLLEFILEHHTTCNNDRFALDVIDIGLLGTIDGPVVGIGG